MDGHLDIATVGYIIQTSKIETEILHVAVCDKGARPIDLSFDIDPDPFPSAPEPCLYVVIGGNITFTPPVLPSDFMISDGV